MVEEYRINQFIALCTGCSRRDAEAYVAAGNVKLNGSVLKELSTKVKTKDKVVLNGKQISIPKFDYYIFYKPAGYITTREDEKGRKTIYDIVPENLYHLKPVGRLDKDSTGLLILTNDGNLMNTMTHPKFHISKKYKVTVKGKFTLDTVDQFARGIDIGEKGLAYAEVITFNKQKTGYTDIVLNLHQGYNRQIRRMVEALKCEVVSLKRLSVGPITLKNLKRGQYTALKQREVNMLLKFIRTKVKSK